jgi:hypothetical protein
MINQREQCVVLIHARGSFLGPNPFTKDTADSIPPYRAMDLIMSSVNVELVIDRGPKE